MQQVDCLLFKVTSKTKFPLQQIPVALKTLRGDQHNNKGNIEFQREAEVMMKLDHPCIVKLYGICQSDNLMMVRLIFFNTTFFCKVVADKRSCFINNLFFLTNFIK